MFQKKVFIKSRGKWWRRRKDKKQSIREEEKVEEFLPKEFMERMKGMLGAEYDAFKKSYQKEAARGLRVNGLKGTKEEFLKKSSFTLRPILWEPNGFFYLEKERPGKHPYHDAGVYYIQEPSAMAVAALAAPKSGEKVLDLCAAPGGKTTHLASQMKGEGLLVANEIHPARAKILSQNVERMGIRNAVVTNEDPLSLKAYFPEFFDRVVVDAPCSGEGMFRKEEAACLEWSLENVHSCAVRQRKILECAAEMLKPGGRLVYSTCTFAPEEDEETILLFLNEHLEFEIDLEIDSEAYREMGFLQGCPDWINPAIKITSEIREKEALKKTFRLFPHKIEGEGHYIAVLHKKEKEGYKKKQKFLRKKRASFKDWEVFQNEIGVSFERGVYQLFGEELYLVPEEMVDMRGLRVLRAGLHLGTLKKSRFEPSHALALTLSPSDTKHVLSFDKESKEIFSYLKGEMLSFNGEERKGWYLVCVDGYSIGWGKASKVGLKNHYPKGLRWM